jgi:ribosomal protein S12
VNTGLVNTLYKRGIAVAEIVTTKTKPAPNGALRKPAFVGDWRT